MPRIRDTESEADMVVKKPRAPRARVALVSDMSTAPRKRAPRKVAARTPSSNPEPIDVPQRKAPTVIAATRSRSNRNLRSLGIVCGICLVLCGGAIFVGTSDKGVIDVVAVVNERNEKINRGEVRDEVTGETVTQTVSVQNGDQRPNGGLQIADPSVPPAVMAPPEATTTQAAASTTDATASSTESAPTVVDPALKPAS